MDTIRVTDVRCERGDSSFLIDDGKTAVLYDTGFGFTGFAVAENIRRALGERKLDYIFLTHSHYDHALGSAYIKRVFPSAKVVAGKYASHIFTREGAIRTMRELDGKFAVKCGVTDYRFLGNELKVDIPAEQGDIINAGELTFEVLELPGHTRCSIGFYCPEKKLLLSSETLGVYDGEKTIVPSYLVSISDSLESIKRVKQLEITSVLAPHYGILNAQQTEYFLENMAQASQQTAEDILHSLKQGKSDDEIIGEFKDKFYHGYIREIYPEDAINLNTSIMIELVRKKLLNV